MTVATWLQELRERTPPAGRFDPQTLRVGLDDALDALASEQLRGVQLPAVRRGFVASSTVPVSPLPFLAAWLGSGGPVVLKASRRAPEFAVWLGETARAHGLPLQVETSPKALAGCEQIVVMGSDETVERVEAETSARVLGFGHRVGLAVVHHDTPSSWQGVARDLRMFDGRGCMSPSVVLTTLPEQLAVERLADALRAAVDVWPVGRRTDGEAAALRSQRALAKVLGRVRSGPGWDVFGVPMAGPEGPFGVARVVSTPDPEEWMDRWDTLWSVIGTDSPLEHQHAPRHCALGDMQRPPFDGWHDGENWLKWSEETA